MSALTTVLKSRFDDAKTAINSKYQISDYLESKGIHVQSNRQICCPFHDDSTPSFSVNFETNEWKCFGCQDGGHFVDIWRAYENKYNNGHYTVYSSTEAILSIDTELQVQLGFKSIFKSEEDNFDLFLQNEEQAFQFDKLLAGEQKIKIVNTDSMKQVLLSLQGASNDEIVKFIIDCQNGMSESQLISKYYRKQADVENYIATIDNNASATELTSAFMEALNDE